MRRRRWCVGSAGAEYLGVIAIVGIVFAGLVTVAPHRIGAKAPVDAVTPIVRLLRSPLTNLTPRPVRPARPRPPRPVRRPPRQPRPPDSVVIPLPEWWR